MNVNKTLLSKYYQGRCNEAEERIVEEWLQQPEAFTGTLLADNEHNAKARMWGVIRSHTVGKRTMIRWYAAAACLPLFIVTGGFILWNRVPNESTYVIIDNTHSGLSQQQQMGKIRLSQSANSALKYNKQCVLFSNYLVINNQQGEDVWVYLKTSSEKGSGMMKFLCKGKRTYVAGFITEHGHTGNRKYLYSKESSLLPEEITASINSQLNATKINAKDKGYTTIII